MQRRLLPNSVLLLLPVVLFHLFNQPTLPHLLHIRLVRKRKLLGIVEVGLLQAGCHLTNSIKEGSDT